MKIVLFFLILWTINTVIASSPSLDERLDSVKFKLQLVKWESFDPEAEQIEMLFRKATVIHVMKNWIELLSHTFTLFCFLFGFYAAYQIADDFYRTFRAYIEGGGAEVIWHIRSPILRLVMSFFDVNGRRHDDEW